MPGFGFRQSCAAILRDAAVRMVGTVAPVVDRGADRSQLLRHPAMKRDNILLAIESFGDARLVRHDEQIIAGVIEPLHRFSRAGDPVDLFRRGDIRHGRR